MAEVLELKVKSNIKGVVTEVDSLTDSLKALNIEASNLNEQISIQNGVIIDLERELINLKSIQDSIPKGQWYAGQSALTQQIKDVTHEINLEKNALVDLNNQQRNNSDALKSTTTSIKARNVATATGTPISRAAGVAMKGIGHAMKAMGIGLIISAFLLLKKVLMSNKTVMKAVKLVVTTLSNLFSDIVNVLKDTYNWVKESNGRFDSMGKVISGLINLSLTPLKLSFYAIKLAMLELMKSWFMVKAIFGDEEAISQVSNLNAKIAETKRDLVEVAEGAVASFTSVVNNAAGAIDEFKGVIDHVSTGMRKVSLDTVERNEELVESEGKTAKEIKTIAQKLIEFKQRLANQQAKNEKQTEKEKIQARREAHLAELNALEINAEEKARLTKELNTMYDQQEKERKDAVDEKEAAELAELEAKNMLAEIDDLTERALKVLEIQRAADLEAIADHENFEAMKAAINKKYNLAAKKLDKKELEWKDITTKAKISMAEGAFGDMSTILGKETEAGKAAAIAQATVQTYLGATKAFTSMASIPVVGPTLGALAAGAAIAAGIKNIEAITAGTEGDDYSDVPSEGDVSDTTPAPEMMSGAFTLGGGQAVEPARAYVVSDDITANQNKLAIIRRRATI